MYDYGWRQYMPDLGRWNGMDQLSEKFHSYSPYAYVMNNPISFFDPDGRDVKETNDGWTFTGSDINLIFSYFKSGGGFSNMSSQLDTYFGGGGGGMSGGISNFWGSFNGGNVFGGVNVSGGTLSWWTNSNASYGGNNIQGLDGHRTKIDQSGFNSFMSNNGYNSSSWDWQKMNDGINGFAFGNEIKTQMMDYAVRNNYKSARSFKEFEALRETQKSWRYTNTLGKGGAKYLSVVKGLGTALGVVGAVDAGIDFYNNPTPGNFLKLSVNTALLVGKVNPIVAVGVGLLDVTGATDYMYESVDNALGY